MARHSRRSTGGARSKTETVLLFLLVLALAVGACLLFWLAFKPAALVDAPLPAGEFTIHAGSAPVGPTGETPVDISGAAMTVADMGPNTLFIPALGIYMPIESDSTFVASQYEDLQTLRIPDDPATGVRYSGGAPMAGGSTGTTLIASHVSTASGWGALRTLHQLTGGELIYTVDDTGQVQTWQTSRMRVEAHTEFPQEYWSADGARRLVITTCGGAVNQQGLYAQNIFVEAVPVAE